MASPPIEPAKTGREPDYEHQPDCKPDIFPSHFQARFRDSAHPCRENPWKYLDGGYPTPPITYARNQCRSQSFGSPV